MIVGANGDGSPNYRRYRHVLMAFEAGDPGVAQQDVLLAYGIWVNEFRADADQAEKDRLMAAMAARLRAMRRAA